MKGKHTCNYPAGFNHKLCACQCQTIEQCTMLDEDVCRGDKPHVDKSRQGEGIE